MAKRSRCCSKARISRRRNSFQFSDPHPDLAKGLNRQSFAVTTGGAIQESTAQADSAPFIELMLWMIRDAIAPSVVAATPQRRWVSP
ncbi:hypothetical protein THIOKS11570032 [Thiocapsa sp. KS1]|nr:hypothetical protein THIOKS11570032 [Thiocapsa sp. KS1]